MSLNLERAHTRDHEHGEQAAGGSALEEIRRRYRVAKRERRLALPVPGELGELVKVRYRPVDDFEHVEGRSTIDTTLDFLIHACDCILTRSGEQWEPLIDQDGDPVGFDETLSALFELGVPPVEQGGTARQVVLAVFAGAPLPTAAALRHSRELTRWMETGKAAVDEEELLGES